jgi:hypothetical protein
MRQFNFRISGPSPGDWPQLKSSGGSPQPFKSPASAIVWCACVAAIAYALYYGDPVKITSPVSGTLTTGWIVEVKGTVQDRRVTAVRLIVNQTLQPESVPVVNGTFSAPCVSVAPGENTIQATEDMTGSNFRPASNAVKVTASRPSDLNSRVVVWGNNADTGILEAIDLATGSVIQHFAAPNPEARDGRGILVLGTKIYYTAANSGKIFVTDSETHADLGVLFDTGLGRVAALAWDGTHLWASPYGRENAAHEYDASGNLLKAIPLRFAQPHYDGLEIVDGHVVANEGDEGGTYDVYDLSGNVLQRGFITVPNSGTGIAFNGTQYVVSEGPFKKLAVYDLNRTLEKEIPLPCSNWLEDLSFAIDITHPPPAAGPKQGNAVPTRGIIDALSGAQK